MADLTYNVNFSDSSKTDIVITPGSRNFDTSLVLHGQKTVAYGKEQQENLLHLLENFCAPTSPINPIEGQLWFDSSQQGYQFYNGTSWNFLIPDQIGTTTYFKANATTLEGFVNTSNKFTITDTTFTLQNTQLLLPVGSLSTLSLAFGSDTNTGFYRSGTSDVLTMVSGGIEVAHFSNDSGSLQFLLSPGTVTSPNIAAVNNSDTGVNVNTAGLQFIVQGSVIGETTTNGIGIIDGTAGNPSIYRLLDNTTGFGFPSATSLALYIESQPYLLTETNRTTVPRIRTTATTGVAVELGTNGTGFNSFSSNTTVTTLIANSTVATMTSSYFQIPTRLTSTDYNDSGFIWLTDAVRGFINNTPVVEFKSNGSSQKSLVVYDGGGNNAANPTLIFDGALPSANNTGFRGVNVGGFFPTIFASVNAQDAFSLSETTATFYGNLVQVNGSLLVGTGSITPIQKIDNVQQIYAGFIDELPQTSTSNRVPTGWIPFRFATGEYELTHNLNIPFTRQCLHISFVGDGDGRVAYVYPHPTDPANIIRWSVIDASEAANFRQNSAVFFQFIVLPA